MDTHRPMSSVMVMATLRTPGKLVVLPLEDYKKSNIDTLHRCKNRVAVDTLGVPDDDGEFSHT